MKFRKKTYSFTIAADETLDEVAVTGITGEVVKLVVTLPDWTNGVTAVVSAINGDEKEIYASDALAENQTHNIIPTRFACIFVDATNEAWKVTLSGVPGGTGGTAIVNVYMAE